MQLGGEGTSLPNPAAAPRRRIPISTPLTVSPPPVPPHFSSSKQLARSSDSRVAAPSCPPSGEGSAGELASLRVWIKNYPQGYKGGDGCGEGGAELKPSSMQGLLQRRTTSHARAVAPTLPSPLGGHTGRRHARAA